MEIKKLLSDVEEELKYVQHKYLTLETVGYDIVYIMDTQKMLYKQYK